MASKLEPFFRFLVTHAMGALVCFLSVQSLIRSTDFGRFLPLLVLLAGLILAWQYRHKTQRSRDGIIATLCAPLAVVLSQHECMESAMRQEITLPESSATVFLGFFAWSLALIVSAAKGQYWKSLGGTMVFLWVLTVVSLILQQSGRL